MTKTIAVVNQKGGVGKTTTVVNLGTALAAIGKKILLVDIDPQGNATSGLGLQVAEKENTVYYLLLGKKQLNDISLNSEIANLTILPANMHLAAAELELPSIDNGVSKLKEGLAQANDFDFILIDCPPSLNFLTLNALYAADSVIVPLQCEYYALEGLSHLLETIERVKDGMNTSLDIEGILLTMKDKRNKLSLQVENDVRYHLKKLVYQTVIPRNVKVSEAPSHGKPVLIYDIKSPGAKAYINLAAEIIENINEDVVNTN